MPIAATNTGWAHWAGLRADGKQLEFALIGPTGEVLSSERVANAPRAVAKLVKHWKKKLAIDPAGIVFCAESRAFGTGAVLEWMVENGWSIKLLDAQVAQEEGLEVTGPISAEALARTGINSPLEAGVESMRRLLGHKLEHLRLRRNELVGLRERIQQEMALQHTRFEEELAREFDRLDRRHVQVIDRIVLRLDTLISLQARRA